MRIGIDIRSLMDKNRSGVGEYVFNVLNNLFEIDQHNQYFLFYNSFKKVDHILPNWNYNNVKFVGHHQPNKLFNFQQNFFKKPYLDKLVGGVDIFWLPNFHFANLSSQVKKIITVHDLSFEIYPEFFSFKRRYWHRILKTQKLVKNMDQIIAVSQNTKQDLIDLYNINKEKINVIYPSVSQDFKKIEDQTVLQQVKNKYNLPDNFILYLGNLEPRKNLIGLIQAFEKIKSDVNLVLAGQPGWLYRQIFNLAQKSYKKNKIHFLGYVDYRDRPALYNLAQIFIYPSFYEGFGLPPLEAMACGCPVVSSFSSSLGEVVDSAGLLVDPYDIMEISQAIDQILQNSDLKQDLIEKGLDQVKKFDWQKTAQDILKIFEK